MTVLLSACVGPAHISPREFQSQYELGGNQTMRTSTYLGQRGGKAYLCVRSMSVFNAKKWSDRVVYVNLSELDAPFRDSLPEKEMSE